MTLKVAAPLSILLQWPDDPLLSFKQLLDLIVEQKLNLSLGHCFSTDKASDRTLTAMVWEGRPEMPDGQLESNYFLAIFDLNQWYYAQMPAKIK